MAASTGSAFNVNPPRLIEGTTHSRSRFSLGFYLPQLGKLVWQVRYQPLFQHIKENHGLIKAVVRQNLARDSLD